MEPCIICNLLTIIKPSHYETFKIIYESCITVMRCIYCSIHNTSSIGNTDNF